MTPALRTSALVSLSGSRSTSGSPFSTKKYGDRVSSAFVSSAAPGGANTSASQRTRATAFHDRFISFLLGRRNALPQNEHGVHRWREYEAAMKLRCDFVTLLLGAGAARGEVSRRRNADPSTSVVTFCGLERLPS